MIKRFFRRVLELFAWLLMRLFDSTGQIQLFVNYRQDDIDGSKRAKGAHRETNPTTRLIVDVLRSLIGDQRDEEGNRVGTRSFNDDKSDRIYLDADDLLPGDDWRAALRQQHRQSSAVICLIGPNWLKPVDRNDGWGPIIRLEEPRDVLRSELEVALTRGIPVIPVFVNRREMLSPQQIPPQLGDFCSKQGKHLEISEEDLFEYQSFLAAKDSATDSQSAPARMSFAEKMYARQLRSILALTRDKIEAAKQLKWMAIAKDTLVFIAVSLVVLCPLTFLLWRYWNGLASSVLPLLVCAVGIAPFLVPVVLSWKSFWLIYRIRGEEPGFGILSAYKELLTCYLQCFGPGELKLVARVRTEFAIVVPPPTKHANSTDRFGRLKREWQNRLRETVRDAVGGKRSRDHDVVRPELRVPTCFQLNSAKDRISRYLTLRSSLWHRESSASFYCWIVIEQGFLAPQFLVAGLQDHFNEDWRPSLDWYGAAVEMVHPSVCESLRQFQAFQFLCWLTWGPSIPLCTCPQWRVKHAGRGPGDAPLMLQFGYGDENNSWLIIDDPRHRSPVRVFMNRSLKAYDVALDQSDPRQQGEQVSNVHHRGAWAFQCEAKVIPVSIKQVQNDMCEAQAGAPSDLALKILAIDRFVGAHVHESRRIYQAYVWVMFVICDERGKELFPKSSWYGLVPFFTHGNIAEPTTYQFIREEVARKALDCLEALATESPQTCFRYACSSDHSNCNQTLEFAPPVPTILDLLHQGKARRLSDSIRPRILLPQLRPIPADDFDRYEENHDFAGRYSACRLPERIKEFYTQLEESQRSAEEVAESSPVH